MHALPADVLAGLSELLRPHELCALGGADRGLRAALGDAYVRAGAVAQLRTRVARLRAALAPRERLLAMRGTMVQQVQSLLQAGGGPPRVKPRCLASLFDEWSLSPDGQRRTADVVRLVAEVLGLRNPTKARVKVLFMRPDIGARLLQCDGYDVPPPTQLAIQRLSSPGRMSRVSMTLGVLATWLKFNAAYARAAVRGTDIARLSGRPPLRTAYYPHHLRAELASAARELEGAMGWAAVAVGVSLGAAGDVSADLPPAPPSLEEVEGMEGGLGGAGAGAEAGAGADEDDL